MQQELRGTAITLDHLESAMNRHYRQLQLYRGSKEEETGVEIALTATDENIVCFKCQKKGHKASNCPNN
jgi:hypothetical protein